MSCWSGFIVRSSTACHLLSPQIVTRYRPFGTGFKPKSKSLRSAQISSALAPFYFSVHPDFFLKHPRERVVNENSLKLLNAFLESGTTDARGVLKLPFYLRNDKGSTLTAVEIHLETTDLRQAVKEILRTCRLPTEYVDGLAAAAPRLKEFSVDPRFGSRVRAEMPPYYHDYVDPDDWDEECIEFSEFTLGRWLQESCDRARGLAKASEKALAEAEMLRKELIDALALADIAWDCGWSAIHERGILLSFRALHRDHPEIAEYLRGIKVIFGFETGVTLKGDLVLNSGEPRTNWFQMITRMQDHWVALGRVPAMERALSRSLKDVKVTHRRFHPTILAEDYESNLRQLVTSIADYRGRFGFPRHWPETLSHLQLVVESAAGPLTLSPTGQLITPSSCPAGLLVKFIDEKMGEAVELLKAYEEDSTTEAHLMNQCRIAFSIKYLSKDNHVSPKQMISFCQRLLRPSAGNLTGYWKDTYVVVSTYYSVCDDGVMHVPWNFK